MKKYLFIVISLVFVMSCRTEYRLKSGFYSEGVYNYDLAMPTTGITLYVTDSLIAFIDTNWLNGDTVVTLAKYSYIGNKHYKNNFIKVKTLDDYRHYDVVVTPSYATKKSDSVTITTAFDGLYCAEGTLCIEIQTIDSIKRSLLNKTIHYNPTKKNNDFTIPQFDYCGIARIFFNFTPDSLKPFIEYNSIYFGTLNFNNTKPLDDTYDQSTSKFKISPQLDSLSVLIRISDNDIVRYNLKNCPLETVVNDRDHQIIAIQGQYFELDTRQLRNVDYDRLKKFVDKEIRMYIMEKNKRI